MNSHRDQAASLRTLLAVLRRRLPILLVCLLGVPASALALSMMQEKQYTADASLLFRDPGLDQKLFGSTFVQPSRDPARDAATNVKLVSLDAVAARTARTISGDLTPREISSKVSVVSDGQSDLATVEATDTSPRRAADLANTFAAQYIEFRREADRSKVREAQQLVERQYDALTQQERAVASGRAIRERLDQLQVLSTLQTGNAELVQRAQIPESQSAPDTFRNVTLGLVFGVLLGVALAFVLERLDRRVRDPKEFEELFARPLLASIPESRALSRGGPARDQPLPAGEQEAFRMLRANLRYFSVDRPVRSVLITSAASGDGKSTVCWNLALAAAGAGARVLLVETDLRHPSLAASAPQLVSAPGLSTVLAGQVEFAEVVQAVPVPTPYGGTASDRTLDVVVAGPLPPNPVDLIESERMRTVLRAAEASYDLVVIDTPPLTVVSDAIPLISEVGGVIVVTRLGKSVRESVAQLSEQLKHLGAPILGVVVNGLKIDYGYGYGYGYGPPATEPEPELSKPDGNGTSANAETLTSRDHAER